MHTVFTNVLKTINSYLCKIHEISTLYKYTQFITHFANIGYQVFENGPIFKSIVNNWICQVSIRITFLTI